MLNPILQALSGNQMNQMNNIMRLFASLKNGDPNAMYQQMIQTNPQFAQFVNQNKNKSPEQIAQENGIDINLLQQFIK